MTEHNEDNVRHFPVDKVQPAKSVEEVGVSAVEWNVQKVAEILDGRTFVRLDREGNVDQTVIFFPYAAVRQQSGELAIPSLSVEGDFVVFMNGIGDSGYTLSHVTQIAPDKDDYTCVEIVAKNEVETVTMVIGDSGGSVDVKHAVRDQRRSDLFMSRVFTEVARQGKDFLEEGDELSPTENPETGYNKVVPLWPDKK